MFVFSNNVTSLPFSKRSYTLMDAKTRYLARHPFVFIDKKSFQNINHIYKSTSFNLLYGKDIPRKKLTKKQIKEINIATLNEICVRHYPRDFLYQTVHKQINIRDSLLRLNSMKYSIKTLENITGKKYPKFNPFLKKMQNLRKNWFQNPNTKQLTKANNEAIRISMEIMHEFRSYLIKSTIKATGKIKYNGIKNKAIFQEEWNKDTALKVMEKLEKNKRYHSILPIEFAPQLVEYSKQKGPISNYIKKNIKGSIQYKIKHKKTLSNRIQIVNNQAKLAYKLKHSDFAAFFDFGYRNTSGINNWLLQVWDKIRHR